MAIKNNRPRTIIINIIALYLFWLILMLFLDLDLSISKITTITIITNYKPYHLIPIMISIFLIHSNKNIDI